ncbi:tyrosine-type recombinase/integrase [Maledivibacter halophilus]|uniref:Integrase/recombinase XerD n=1 Tax=Maledivibacter halophilus TaxID=36842 RepID=A0A1T5MF38_9FIRM|nr:tyrosine-type recombinase/integrase [Maledivibacter halophilus]SKC86817.1 integrase/recombinase XerD [Maledivibacter halophilus]
MKRNLKPWDESKNNFKKYLESYMYHISLEKKLTNGTIDIYKKELERFFQFIEQKYKNKNIKEISEDESIVKDYIYTLVKKGNAEKTINRKISTLRMFFSYLMVSKEFSDIKTSPMINIKNQKEEQKLPVYLTLQECEKFLYGIKFFSTYATRDYALFQVFLSTGARISEICNLELNQINIKNGIVKLYGKGRKERQVILTDSSMEALKAYLYSGDNKDLSKKGRVPKIDTEVVFLNKYGMPFTTKGIYMLFKSLAKRIGIYKTGLSPHKLRHSFATLLKSSGADILEIKKLLGHSSLSSTQIYMHIMDDDVLSKVKSIHPLNKKGIDDDLINRINRRKRGYFYEAR